MWPYRMRGNDDSDSAPHLQASRFTPGTGKAVCGAQHSPGRPGEKATKQTAVQERRATLGPDLGHVLGDTDPS